MKIKVLVIGKTNVSFVSLGVDEYLKRLKRYIKAEIIVLPDVKNSKSLTPEQLIAKEEELLLVNVKSGAETILFDENGETLSSIELANFLQTKMLSGVKELIFIVGGAYGVSSNVKKRVNMQLSVSKLTFSHQMVRLIIVEQLYRAMTILKGEPYHHQ